MSLQAFVDESYRGDYLQCAAVVDSARIATARRAMLGMLRGGQSRIHMAKENDGRRKSVLTQIGAMDTTARMVAVQVSGRSIRSARDAAFAELTTQLSELDVGRLIIESCDQDRRDVQVIGDRLAALGLLGSIDIHHMNPHDEPLLWIPDAIAWAYGKGSKEWRSLVAPMITTFTRL